MAVTETSEGFWPNVVATPHERPPLVAVEAIELEPVALEPVALEPAELEPAALEPAALEPAALEPAALEPAELEPELAEELNTEQAEAFADVIDLEELSATIDEADTDHFHDGITADELAHLPVADGTTLGGDNLAAVRAVNPRGFAAHQELEAAVMTGTETLSVADRTLIGLIVSVENHCGYWQVHLTRRLEAWFQTDRVAAFAADWTHADLPVRDRAMLAFAVKLTLIPGQMTEDDANLLISVGFSERDLLDIVDVVSYWSFATRVVDGLGVFLEPWIAGRQAPVAD